MPEDTPPARAAGISWDLLDHAEWLDWILLAGPQPVVGPPDAAPGAPADAAMAISAEEARAVLGGADPWPLDPTWVLV